MIARLAVAILLLAGLTFAPTPARSTERPAGDERRILVMLRLAPAHFRAGSGYAGAYGEDQSRGGRARIAAKIARRHQLTLAGNWPMPLIGIDCFIMVVPSGRSADAVVAEVATEAEVSWAQPLARYQALGSADPLFAAQPTAKAWRLADLHRAATGRRTKVAVIDSQVDLAHPDLAGQVAVARDFVEAGAPPAENHGTAVAGIVAARLANGLGIAGIAPDARIMALRACWQVAGGSTLCDSLTLAKAVAFAVEQRADVINLSLGGPRDRLLATLLKAAMARGIPVVAAVDRSVPDGGFPASLAGVVPVAATPARGLPMTYSAPGRDIPAPLPGRRWGMVSGASYAAAEVSGLFALLRERRGQGNGTGRLVAAQGTGEIDACASLLGATACGGRVAASVPASPR